MMKITIVKDGVHSFVEVDAANVSAEKLCDMLVDVSQRAGYSRVDLFTHMSKYKTMERNVEKWAMDKGILEKATTFAQAIKTAEEAQELIVAIHDNNVEEIKDAIGDILVTIIIQAKMQGMSVEDCLESAYNVIKSRTGKMVNGQFVKDAR
jgi:NTP pyrophosphatase (non-canonical NTP hydrolase)